MKYSLIIPCFNEEKGLPKLIDRCRDVVQLSDGEIILVNNGSKDNSAKLLKTLTINEPNLRVINVKTNQGYGHGIIQGLNVAQGDIIGWTHADMQTDPMDIIAGLKLFTDSSNPEKTFVKGRRFGRPVSDQFFTLGMSVFETLLLGYFLSDVNAQPTLFHKSFWNSCTNAPDDFSLDLFVYAFAKRNGLMVRRFPVNFSTREHGESSWNINWNGKYKFIKRTLDYSFKLRKRFQKHTQESKNG